MCQLIQTLLSETPLFIVKRPGLTREQTKSIGSIPHMTLPIAWAIVFSTLTSPSVLCSSRFEESSTIPSSTFLDSGSLLSGSTQGLTSKEMFSQNEKSKIWLTREELMTGVTRGFWLSEAFRPEAIVQKCCSLSLIRSVVPEAVTKILSKMLSSSNKWRKSS